MKRALSLAVVVLLVVIQGTCFALWGIHPVSKEQARELGIEFRSTAGGPSQVRVEMEFKLEGPLTKFSRVELRFGLGDNPPVTAPLQEDRSKPGRVMVWFNADRTQLDKIQLWIFVPQSLGGTVYHLQAKDFVDLNKVP
ncbi:MAG: hypothetical protein JSS02_35280 [Planctomycetes bacterium]|nr:hypothetical protein [Planctomycetota bacterium]